MSIATLRQRYQAAVELYFTSDRPLQEIGAAFGFQPEAFQAVVNGYLKYVSPHRQRCAPPTGSASNVVTLSSARHGERGR